MSKSKTTPILTSQRPNTFWRYWAPPVLWALAILAFSGDVGSTPYTTGLLKWVLSWIVDLSPEALTELQWYLRKVFHFVAYGILSVLWFRALTVRFPGSTRANVILALVLCLAVALLDESLQAMVPSRHGSLSDVVLDMAGAALLMAMAVHFRKRTPLKPPGARPPSS